MNCKRYKQEASENAHIDPHEELSPPCCDPRLRGDKARTEMEQLRTPGLLEDEVVAQRGLGTATPAGRKRNASLIYGNRVTSRRLD